jgi:hypothetical protein
MARKIDDREVTEVAGSAAPMEDFQSGNFRTRFASEAVNLAEVFKLLIGTTPLRGPATFHVEMSAPDGPSTGGGVQSVQHIKLVADDGGTTLVAGWCDQNAGTCELRTLDCLDAQHHERFRKSSLKAPPLPSERLDRVHYGKLIERLRTFFAERELRVTLVDAPDVQTQTLIKGETPQPAERGGGRWPAILFGALLGATLAALAYFIVLRR